MYFDPYVEMQSHLGESFIQCGNSFSLFVATNVEEGLKFAFDVRTTLNVRHVIFHLLTKSHSYALYATSADKGGVLFLNLEAGEN